MFINNNYPPRDYARTLAERKAQAVAVTMSRTGRATSITTLIIGSDTIADLDGSISEFDFNVEGVRGHLELFVAVNAHLTRSPDRHPLSE